MSRRAPEPPLTDAEARRRLGEAYRILLDLAAKRRAAQAIPQPAEPTAIPPGEEISTMATPLDEHETASTSHNERTRAQLAAYLTAHGRAWIGKVNIHPPARAELVPYTGQMVHNFEADFAVPHPDPLLLRLIIERQEAPYTGAADDASRVDAIFVRIKELGGLILTWR